MPQLSSYPAATSLAANDKFLINQAYSGTERTVTANLLSSFVSNGGEQLTISGLRSKDVTELSTGYAAMVSGYYTIGDGGGGAFYYNSSSTEDDNGGTVIAPNSGAGRWLRPATDSYNVRQFGALGDGSHNDTSAIQAATDQVSANGRGSVVFPAGKYKISAAITLSASPDANISFIGEGPNVSIITQSGVGLNGLDLTFKNTGVQQPYSVTIENIGLESSVVAGTAIVVSYGDPVATSTHYNHGPLISNVGVRSSDAGYWATGIDLESAWNAKIDSCYISGGAFGGTWASMIGSGIRLRRSCVNTHILNNSINFWQTGLYYNAEGGGTSNANAEGIYCSNNTMVAIKRGVWIQGNTGATSPWVTGFTWSGGMIELRAAINAITLEACSESLVSNTFILADASGVANNATGVALSTVKNATVANNKIYAMFYGVKTDTSAVAVLVSDNVFVGGGDQVTFGAGTSYSTSKGSVVNGAGITELNSAATGTRNKIYQGLDYGFSIGKNAAQSIPDTTETSVIWGNESKVIRNDLDWNLAPGTDRFWNSGTPTRINVPSGVSWVKLTAGIRFNTNSTGFRAMKIRSPETLQNWAAVSTAASSYTDVNASTHVIPVKDLGITYFDVVVSQTSGGALDVRAVDGTFVEMEIIG